MAVKKHRKIIIPFLLGQRREGLCRVREIDSHAWKVLRVPDFKDTKVPDSNEKMRRMGEIYSLLAETVRKAVNNGSVPVTIA